jgi:thioredoxin 2
LFDAIVNAAGVPVLVDFWAPWCGPCKMAGPEIAKAAERLAGRALVLKVNTEQHPELAARYQVRSIPNFALFRSGRLVWQQAGLLRHQELEQIAVGA